MDFGGDGELSYPVGVAFDITERNIIVADRDNHRLLVYNIKTGKMIRKIGRKGVGEGQFDGPSGIFVDGEGRIIVADWNNHRIQVFSSEGLFLFKFGDTVKNKLKHPRAVTFAMCESDLSFRTPEITLLRFSARKANFYTALESLELGKVNYTAPEE